MENNKKPFKIVDIKEFREAPIRKKEETRKVEIGEARREIIEKLREFKKIFKLEIAKLKENAKNYFRKIRQLKQQVTFKQENYLKFCQRARQGPVSIPAVPKEPISGGDIYEKIMEEEEKYDDILKRFDATRTDWHLALFSIYQTHRDRQLVTKSTEFLLLEKVLNILMSFRGEALKESFFEVEEMTEKYTRLLDSI